MNALFPFSLQLLRLNFRQPMAVLYGYIFPLIFLAAFAVVYRHDPRPLGGHMGELLTVTALGGACFGLPTALVAERERGIWKRYRATGAGTPLLLGGVVIARIILLLTAGLLQFAIAAAFCTALPGSPALFALTFVATCLCFIGVGLAIAMLVDSVIAVQALGQCIFLPMLMLGGIAVRPEALPQWLQGVAAALPGIHSVRALQWAFDGRASSIWGHVGVLLLYAAAGAVAAAALYRWDARARPIRKSVLAASGAILLIAVAAGQWAGIGNAEDTAEPVSHPADYLAAASARDRAEMAGPARWQDVDDADIARIAFERLPDDAGIISPLAARGTLDDPATQDVIAQVRAGLPGWAPAAGGDPVQRARNMLYVAAVPDVLQMDPLERHLPWLVFDRLRQDISLGDLRKILFWISQHPDEGESGAISQLGGLGLPQLRGPDDKIRERTMIYALKLLRLLQETRPPDDAPTPAPAQDGT